MGCRERSVRWRSAAAAVLVAVGAVASCGGGDDGGEPDESAAETTAPSVESTTTTLSPTQEVETAFLAFDAMTLRLRATPSPDDPEIAQRASGETLAGIRRSQTTQHTAGLRVEFGERQATHVLEVSMVDSGTATLLGCTVDDRTEITPSGTKGPFLETYWTEWTLLKVDGTWFVDSATPVDRREGEQPCE